MAAECCAVPEDVAPPSPGRSLHVLHFNDVYHADDYGGIADRAVRMRAAMEPYLSLRPLVTFGGDAFAPSLMSTVTRGKHMMEVLELLDVDIATFGNHDLDFGIERARELTKDACLFGFEGPPIAAKMRWVISNMVGLDGAPIAQAERTVVKDVGGIRVGIFAVSEDWLGDAGLSTATTNPDKHARWEDMVTVGRATAAELRAGGAELVLALCHNLLVNTEGLAEQLDVDCLLGGHEHVWAQGQRFVIAGQDFEDFCFLTFDVPEGVRAPPPSMEHVSVAAAPLPGVLTGNTARMGALVRHYRALLEERLRAPLACELRAPLVTTRALLRTREMPAGNLFADAVLAANPSACCCLLIAGVISKGRLVEPIGPLALGAVIGWFPWEGGTCVLRVRGSALLAALEHGCRHLPRRFGCFPQVSGMSFALNAVAPPGSRVSAVLVAGKPLDPDTEYLVATTDYIAEGGDGFDMLAEARPLAVSPEVAPLLHAAVVAHLESLGAIGPQPLGRIRNLTAFHMHVEHGETSSFEEEDVVVPAS